jgi:hypothetical protein
MLKRVVDEKGEVYFARESTLKKLIMLVPLMMNGLLMYASEKNIMLESSVIKIADGTLINADKIEFIRKFRRTLLTFLLGEQLPNNQRKGKYSYQGKLHSIESLARIEQELLAALSQEKDSKKRAEMESSMAALGELLTHVKADFIVQSNEFIESGRGAKNITVVLIQEDCQKRNRPDSLLLDWARTKEGQEATMFEHQIISFNHYYHFLTDLANFLLDLVHSCPKAELQFKDRVAKWSAVKALLPAIFKKAHVKGEHVNEVEFLKYLKERYLDSMGLQEITPQVIAPLLTEYIKHSSTHA